jgi:DNA-binding NarL/FixJ family response regulator
MQGSGQQATPGNGAGQQQLEQAPLTLSARQMDILRLRLDGLTHKEIAARLGMPAGTVGRLWAEAMHLLQIALRDSRQAGRRTHRGERR